MNVSVNFCECYFGAIIKTDTRMGQVKEKKESEEKETAETRIKQLPSNMAVRS